MFMGDDSCLRGRGFESRHLIQDRHDIFSRPKINEQEAGVGPFF